LAAKLTLRSNATEWLGFTLAFLRIKPRSFLLDSIRRDQLGFTLAASVNRTAKFALLIQLQDDLLGFTLAATL
jgi:hypothetical protein